MNGHNVLPVNNFEVWNLKSNLLFKEISLKISKGEALTNSIKFLE